MVANSTSGGTPTRTNTPGSPGEATPLGAQREAHRHLAVLRLPELPTVLPGYAPTEWSLLLRKTGVIDDPKARGITAGDHRHYLPRAGRKHRLIAPLRVNHPMMHRLVRRADILRMYPRRHRLNALPLPRQPQPLQIPPRRLTPIRMRQRLNQYLTLGKTAFHKYHGQATKFRGRKTKQPV